MQKEEHLNVHKTCTLTAARNIIVELQGGQIKRGNVKSMEDVSKTDRCNRKIAFFENEHKTKQYTTTIIKEIRHNANMNYAIVPQTIGHNPNIIASHISNIQTCMFDETSVNANRDDQLSSNEEDFEEEVQGWGKTKWYKHRQSTEQRTEQMHQYRARKHPEAIALQNNAQMLPNRKAKFRSF